MSSDGHRLDEIYFGFDDTLALAQYNTLSVNIAVVEITHEGTCPMRSDPSKWPMHNDIARNKRSRSICWKQCILQPFPVLPLEYFTYLKLFCHHNNASVRVHYPPGHFRRGDCQTRCFDPHFTQDLFCLNPSPAHLNLQGGTTCISEAEQLKNAVVFVSENNWFFSYPQFRIC